MVAGAQHSLEELAHERLLLPRPGAEPDTWLCQRARRLVRGVGELIRQPELAGRACDRRAAETAALFFEVGRARLIAAGDRPRDPCLLQPSDAAWRELSIDALQESAPGRLPPATLDAAVTAIRQYGWPGNQSAEAQVVGETVNLDDIGPLWLWLSARDPSGSAQTLAVFLQQWSTRQRYGYWETRIRDALRFEWSRVIARRRIAAMQVFVESCQAQLEGDG